MAPVRIEHQPGVHLVGADDQVATKGDLGERFQFGLGPYAPYRVVRRAQQ